MKITQDTRTGETKYRLGIGEDYSIEEHLFAIMNFLSAQAVENFKVQKRISHRLEELEELINNGNSAIDRKF